MSRPATILCVGLKKEKREGKPAAFSHAQLKNWERIYVLVSPRTGSQIKILYTTYAKSYGMAT